MPEDYSKVKEGWNILWVTATGSREKSYSSENICKHTWFYNAEVYLKGVEIKSSNRTSVFVRLSHNSICPRAHYDFWVIHSQNAIFTAAY